MATPTVPRSTARAASAASAPIATVAATSTAATTGCSVTDGTPGNPAHSGRTGNPDTPHHARRPRLRQTILSLTLLLVVLLAGVPAGQAGSAVWWALDSGPLAASPRDILTEPSPVGAVRVFGDHPGTDPDEAARRTVDALDAAGGFDRSILSINLPTGSGWVDPDQVEAVEQWAHGDISSVSVRYSSAPSAAVFLLRRDLAEDSASALVREIVDRVGTLPAGHRPQIIVHGQSLGALVGADILAGDPRLRDAVSAALWQGMPGGADTDTSADRCTVSRINDDDPVAKLSASLLIHPVEAARVLTSLPGSQHGPAGSGHSYGAVLPPTGCVTW